MLFFDDKIVFMFSHSTGLLVFASNFILSSFPFFTIHALLFSHP